MSESVSYAQIDSIDHLRFRIYQVRRNAELVIKQVYGERCLPTEVEGCPICEAYSKLDSLIRYLEFGVDERDE